MNAFKFKRNFKKISILVAIPYIILCITAGGLHSFDKRAYHGHCFENHSTKKENSENHIHYNQENKNTASFCFNDHSSDKCGICKWLKSTAKRVQFVQKNSSLFQDSSKACIIDHATYYFLKLCSNSPRSPPFFIS